MVNENEYVVYSGGYLRTPPGAKLPSSGSSSSSSSKVAGYKVKGHYLTLVTGKGNNTKSSSKLSYSHDQKATVL